MSGGRESGEPGVGVLVCLGCHSKTCLNPSLLKVHENRWVVDPLGDVLNSHWPRSKQNRTETLLKSNDGLPLHFALVLCDGKTVIGGYSFAFVVHSPVTTPHPVGIENVLVSSQWRGRNYGTILLNHAQKTATEMGFDAIYLSTKDKHDFYAHHGFIDGPSVTITPSTTLASNSNVLTLLQNQQIHPEQPSVATSEAATAASTSIGSDPSSKITPCPPPAPPPPRLSTKSAEQKLYWMWKHL
ncbi:hypothetical protein Pelo_12879 [Pelomyxa schiedti]|nr:hypothetical protein Pelo_12879 [Pelomyxa schiedti]